VGTEVGDALEAQAWLTSVKVTNIDRRTSFLFAGIFSSPIIRANQLHLHKLVLYTYTSNPRL
jgi:hypothetical protein